MYVVYQRKLQCAFKGIQQWEACTAAVVTHKQGKCMHVCTCEPVCVCVCVLLVYMTVLVALSENGYLQ